MDETMEITNRTLLEAAIALESLSGQTMGVRDALRVRRIRKALESEAEPVRETYDETVQRIREAPEGSTEARTLNDELRDLMDATTELDVDVDPVPVDALNDSVRLAPAHLDALMTCGLISENGTG